MLTTSWAMLPCCPFLVRLLIQDEYMSTKKLKQTKDLGFKHLYTQTSFSKSGGFANPWKSRSLKRTSPPSEVSSIGGKHPKSINVWYFEAISGDHSHSHCFWMLLISTFLFNPRLTCDWSFTIFSPGGFSSPPHSPRTPRDLCHNRNRLKTDLLSSPNRWLYPRMKGI